MIFSNVVLVAVHLEDGPDAVPLGVACVAAAIKTAFPQSKVSISEGFVAEGRERLLSKIEAALRDMASSNTGLWDEVAALGFSLCSWNRNLIVSIAQDIHSKYPKLFLFCGGPEATALPEGLTKPDGPFDALIQGEGEHTVIRMMKENVAGVLHEPIGSIDGLPSPWLDGTLRPQVDKGVLWELARGCPFGCAYCFESKGSRRVRYFSENRVLEELRLFIKSKVPYVFVLDPTFNVDANRAIHILETIAKEGALLKRGQRTKQEIPHFHFEVRAEYLTRSQARRFSAIGATLQIGLQTANPKAAALVNRSFDRNLFASKVQLLNEADVIFGLDLIYGLPGDSFADYKKSLDFAVSLSPNNIDMFRLSVLPGTALFDKADELGLVFNRHAPYNLISTRTFPQTDLNTAEYLSKAADIFYNQGRSVPWFTYCLYLLGMKASVFFEEFAQYLEESGKNLADTDDLVISFVEIKKIQLDFIKKLSKKKKKDISEVLRQLFH
jgi:radical SAM superfamily enzyme YgiQ (UPF0313 family)